MSESEWEILYFVSANGSIPFKNWFDGLHDYKAQAAIDARLARLRAGNFGNRRLLGKSIMELKIDYGPGYRIYYARTANKVVLLLCGGDKSTQRKDILTARQYWESFKKEL